MPGPTFDNMQGASVRNALLGAQPAVSEYRNGLLDYLRMAMNSVPGYPDLYERTGQTMNVVGTASLPFAVTGLPPMTMAARDAGMARFLEGEYPTGNLTNFISGHGGSVAKRTNMRQANARADHGEGWFSRYQESPYLYDSKLKDAEDMAEIARIKRIPEGWDTGGRINANGNRPMTDETMNYLNALLSQRNRRGFSVVGE